MPLDFDLWTFSAIIIWGAYPIATLIFCWRNKTLSNIKKTLWSLFIVISWPLMALGAIIHGLIYYKKFYKFIPLLGVLFIVFNFTYLLKGYLNPDITNIMYNHTKKVIEKTIQDPQRALLLDSQIDTLNQEILQDMETRQVKYNYLLSYMIYMLYNDMTDQEFQSWLKAYENRHTLTEEQVKELRDISKENLLNKTIEEDTY